MNKTEIISRIIDRITDPFTESHEDYLYADLIDLECAKDILNQYREDDIDFDPEDRMPEETTPELLMEAYNCNIRYHKYELKVNRLADYIIANEMVCEYANYYYPCHDDAIDLFPVEFLDTNDVTLTTIDGTPMSSLDLIELGQRSKMFHSSCEYCYYDQERDQLFSTDCPFHDGTLDAKAFAKFVLEDKDTLDYFVNCIMNDNDIQYVFGCAKEELLKEDK